MKTTGRAAFLLIIALQWIPARLAAQEIDAVVSVNANTLPASLQQEVAGFGEELQRYINSARWTGDEWKGDKVQMNFNVAFTGVSGGEYTVKLVVGSQRRLAGPGAQSPMMKILDDKWSFQYSRNQPFYQDPSGYDELSSLVDFYVYIALGLDMDSRTYLGGQPMYDRARTIAQRAQNARGVNGWDMNAPAGQYARYSLVRELGDLRYNPIRQFIYDYHHTALDLMATDRAAGLDSANNCLTSLVLTIDRLVEPTTLVRVLTDTKYTEFSEMFIRYPDPIVWKKLLYIDPRHQSYYEAARNK